MIPVISDPLSGRRRSRLGRIFKWLIMSMALIVLAGAVFQFSMTLWESHLYPPPGKLVDIGGLRLHINCTGAGSPTVIMEAGPNDSSVIWQLVQPEISRFTRVCSYDRAGFGWSDAPNEPRTSINIANELERLLTRAAVPGPYVLVGHDFGTLDLRVFAARHRQQVAGMVFVDSVILTYTIGRHSTWLLSPLSRTRFTTLSLGPCRWECPEYSAGVERISRSRTSPRNGLG